MHAVRCTLQPRPAAPPSRTVHLPHQALNGGAEIIETVRSNVDLARILGVKAFSLERILEEEPDFLSVGAKRDLSEQAT